MRFYVHVQFKPPFLPRSQKCAALPRATAMRAQPFSPLESLRLFTECSDDERDDTSSTESIVGILEWTRGAITAVPRYIWSKDLINSLDLSNVFPPT